MYIMHHCDGKHLTPESTRRPHEASRATLQGNNMKALLAGGAELNELLGVRLGSFGAAFISIFQDFCTMSIYSNNPVSECIFIFTSERTNHPNQ